MGAKAGQREGCGGDQTGLLGSSNTEPRAIRASVIPRGKPEKNWTGSLTQGSLPECLDFSHLGFDQFSGKPIWLFLFGQFWPIHSITSEKGILRITFEQPSQMARGIPSVGAFMQWVHSAFA